MSCVLAGVGVAPQEVPAQLPPDPCPQPVQLKRLSEHEKFTLLKEKIEGLEASLAAEGCQRSEADRSIHAHIDAEISKLAERTAGDVKQLQLAVKSSLEQLSRSVSELNTIVSDEKEQRKADTDHVAMSLCERIDQVVHTVDEERFSRLEHERQSLKRCAHDRFRVGGCLRRFSVSGFLQRCTVSGFQPRRVSQRRDFITNKRL